MLKFKKNNSTKTVIMLSEDGVYSVRVNRFFQLFLIASSIILSSFLTYHLTLYITTQNTLQEKDHKISVGEVINKNLTSHLEFIIDELSYINSSIETTFPQKKKDSSQSAKSEIKKQKLERQILTDEDLVSVENIIKTNILNIDKTLDKKIESTVKLAHSTDIADLMKLKKIYDYKDYKSYHFIAKNINYDISEIASEVLSETKYKLEYLKTIQDFIAKLPILYPVKIAKVTSNYGVRNHPVLDMRMFHHGIDFKGPSKAPIHATGDAVVKFAGWSNSYGNVVILDHGDDIITIYAHLTAYKVKIDQVVKKNDVIGLQGSTGRSSGEHLHYEIRYKGRSINPVKFLRLSEMLEDNY